MSRKKLILFSVITTFMILSCLELTARIVLSLKKDSWQYMFYGVKGSTQDKQVKMVRGKKFRWVTGENGERLYYKAPVSKDEINPVNSLGFRGRELQTKTKEVTRVVCLGGSTTYGADLNFKDTYPKLLQEKLDGHCGAHCYEVVNGGQPGLNFSQIIALVQREILPLRPDILIVMSINNNFKAPGFWFVRLENEEQDIYDYTRKVRNYITSHLVLGLLVDNALKDNALKDNAGHWVGEYFVNFDWEAFSRALMSEDNIWEEPYRSNAQRIVEVFLRSNPAGKVLFLEQAVNTMRFPEMELPFNAAKEILRHRAAVHDNVYTLDIHHPLIAATQEGEQVWQSPDFDPLHLSRRGNELLVDLVAQALLFNGCARTAVK